MVYDTVTISVPHELCQKIIRDIETMSDVWEVFDILKRQVKRDERAFEALFAFSAKSRIPNSSDCMDSMKL